MPVMRAMPLAFPDDPPAWRFEEQYLLGPSLLVAPVLAPGGKVQIYLPAGGWYDSSLLPLGHVVQHTAELPAGSALDEIWVFGSPEEDLELPDVYIGRNLSRIPSGVRVRRW